MATLQQISDELAALRNSVQLEHEQAATALEALNTTIQELRDIIANGDGATPEQLDAVLDQVIEVREMVHGIIPDTPVDPDA